MHAQTLHIQVVCQFTCDPTGFQNILMLLPFYLVYPTLQHSIAYTPGHLDLERELIKKKTESYQYEKRSCVSF